MKMMQALLHPEVQLLSLPKLQPPVAIQVGSQVMTLLTTTMAVFPVGLEETTMMMDGEHLPAFLLKFLVRTFETELTKRL